MLKWLFGPFKPWWFDFLTDEEKEQMEKLFGPDWGNLAVIDTVKELLAMQRRRKFWEGKK